MIYKWPLHFFIYTAFLCNSCSTMQNSNLANEALVINQRSIVYSYLIKKPFIKKNGKPTENKEFYLLYMNKSYFIKFCESQVSRESAEMLYSTNNKGLTFEVELANGEWDICDNNLEQQSRVGEYILLHNIIE